MKNNYNKFVVIIMALLVATISLACIFTPLKDYSDSERRKLATMPKFNLKNVLNTSFMTDFEDYALDQFIFRDNFRALKSFSELFIFNKEDVNKLYVKDGYLSKLEYPLSMKDINHASSKFKFIYDKYLSENNHQIYLSIVPDKNYFLAEDKLSLDYQSLIDEVTTKNDFMTYIDITKDLSINDYYHSDTHWRQGNIVKIAKHIADSLGVTVDEDYEKVLATNDFKGVFEGQIALDIVDDELYYLTNDKLQDFIVTKNDGNGPKEIPLYNLDKANDKDPYELFAGGNSAIIEITNPHATNDKELIIFRDSFTSSLAPLLASGYAKTTLVDIRYIQSNLIENYLEFNDQDILFLYSTLLLNNSVSLK